MMQLVPIVCGVVAGAICDYDVYYQAKKVDPTVKFDWWPFVKRTGLGLCIGFGGAGVMQFGQV